MAPILKFTTSSGSKKTEPRYKCKKKSLKIPSKESPSMFPQQVPYGERRSFSRANGLFIHLYLSDSPKRNPPTKCVENIWSPATEAPCKEKAYLQWGAVWFPKVIVNDTTISTPVSCSLQHDTFHLAFGRPEPC